MRGTITVEVDNSGAFELLRGCFVYKSFGPRAALSRYRHDEPRMIQYIPTDKNVTSELGIRSAKRV